MKLSFVIPAHNEEQYLGSCIESILAATKKTDWQTEIVVVNNASTDRTATVAKKYPAVRVVDEPKKGLTQARQRGLLTAQGELLAYLDADSRLSPDWLAILEKSFGQSNVVCLSGPYRYYDLTGLKKFLAEGIWWLFAPFTYRLVGYMVLGGNFVARKEALLAMGGFDTNIQFYGEDTNIAWRLNRLGKVLFRVDFFVDSSGRGLAQEGLLRSYWIYGVNYLWGSFFHKPFTHEYRDIR